MLPPLALFRADASSRLGTGHVMRCLTLADALEARGWRCRFWVNQDAPATVPALAARHWDVAPPDFADLLVVDHYGLDAAFERECRSWVGRIGVIDDLADRPHACDWLLDQNAGRLAADYASRVPAGARLWLGPKAALLRPDFAAHRQGALSGRRGTVGRALVAFGGTDPDNASGLALAALEQAGLAVETVIVLGAAAPHLAELRRQAAAVTFPVEIRVNVADMAALMASCDLAIGAGGTSSWERCCLGLPSVVVVIADNQRLVAEGLQAAGAALVAPKDQAALARILAGLVSDADALTAMAAAASGLCDGQGAERLADWLDGGRVALRPATSADGAALLEWRNDPVTCANSRSTGPVDPVQHYPWLDRVLADPGRTLWIGEEQGRPVGMVRFDPAPMGGFEVAINVAPSARGGGTGRRLLLAAVDAFSQQKPGAVLHAEILDANQASRSIFARAGFAPVGRKDGWVQLTKT